MSTKSSIILTNDNEHWYSDCSEYTESGEFILTLEFSKENIRIELNDDHDLVISIIKDCELLQTIKKASNELDKAHEEVVKNNKQ